MSPHDVVNWVVTWAFAACAIVMVLGFVLWVVVDAYREAKALLAGEPRVTLVITDPKDSHGRD